MESLPPRALKRFAQIERDLQRYGDGPPYYPSLEAEVMGRMVADIQWLHDELLKALAR